MLASMIASNFGPIAALPSLSTAAPNLSSALPNFIASLPNFASASVSMLPLAQSSSPIPGIIILLLCGIAGIGTLLLLPSTREAAARKIGGTMLVLAALIGVATLIHTFGDQTANGVGVYFWIFSAIALVGAIRVVTHPRPVYSALYFVLTVFATAGLFVLLWAQFMAAALVLIYAGAILITYVFVIMLAAQAQSPSDAKPLAGLAEYDLTSREPTIAACVGFVLMGVILFVTFDKAQGLETADQTGANISQAIPQPAEAGSTQSIGYYLFDHQLVNLELASLILTLAMVGAIVIARKRVIDPNEAFEPTTETVIGPFTPVDDNPHSIPVLGTKNPRQKAYPER
jgi:NADH-quinone oxidoreductase subunit J